jgi:protoheme IX farnesyltransferase
MKSAVHPLTTEVLPRSASPSLAAFIQDISELVKARLTFLVLCTTAAGFYMGAEGPLDWWRLAATLLGTGMVAAAASALNQYLERDVDRLMRRTANRPLATGRLPVDETVVLAVSAAVIGAFLLAVTVNMTAAALALVTLWLYVGVYTPMKRWSVWNTMVGAIPGALPPAIGWAGGRGDLGMEALVLFGILFFWQIPHFMAIAWLYRDDYKRAGFCMIPIGDSDGSQTGRESVLYSVLLVVMSVVPYTLGMAGSWYLILALTLSIGFAALAFRFAARPIQSRARWLFLASILYLPLLLGVLAVDKI